MRQRKYVFMSFTAVLILVAGLSLASAAIRTVTIKVQGMTCGGCATNVEKALKSTEGVEDAQVSFERGKAVIKYDDQKITVDKLREVIQSTGFFCEVKR